MSSFPKMFATFFAVTALQLLVLLVPVGAQEPSQDLDPAANRFEVISVVPVGAQEPSQDLDPAANRFEVISVVPVGAQELSLYINPAASVKEMELLALQLERQEFVTKIRTEMAGLNRRLVAALIEIRKMIDNESVFNGARAEIEVVRGYLDMFPEFGLKGSLEKASLSRLEEIYNELLGLIKSEPSTSLPKDLLSVRLHLHY